MSAPDGPKRDTVVPAPLTTQTWPLASAAMPRGPAPVPKVPSAVPEATTVKGEPLVAVRPSTVTATGPVVAPGGTRTANCPALAVSTVAATPLTVTPLPAGVVEK
ncbi:hypothetical protein D3C72_731250 [compost metagenome]